MDVVREYIQKPWVMGAAGLVVGLIIGWFIIGWGLWPVQWTDAAPEHLRADLQVDYMRMAIDSYAQNQDATLAKSRFDSLGEGAEQALAEIEENPGTQNPTAITAFRTAVAAQALPSTIATTEAEAQPRGSSIVRVVLPIMCAVTLLIAGLLVALFVIRSRAPGARPTTAASMAQPAAPASEWSEYTTPAEEPPMAQFMATYKLGDDLFDDSFSIDSPAGEFLGECGVGISETIGVGEPKKVTAFEAWLFDKNDIQTVTKVLMSAHAYQDEGTRQRLAAKGEPVLVEVGKETILDTQTLRLVVRVIDMGYGDGALPPHSYFERLILELAVWSKAV